MVRCSQVLEGVVAAVTNTDDVIGGVGSELAADPADAAVTLDDLGDAAAPRPASELAELVLLAAAAMHGGAWTLGGYASGGCAHV
jgi:hypothetical protein